MIRFQTIEPKAAPKIAPQPRPTRTIVDRLADAICELAGEQRPITNQALLDRGFTEPVIKRFADQARALARRRFIKHI
ncbi:hypothetical protein [Rhizobium sp. AB2/73]|uniref:hypothetical protein n=1 Tax=Rhizobium sp. AB2/73 TaxID=2795216 RepID=UPI001C5FD12D|nr:hypothetical protein [Rhizobium sp. AB2/73]QYA12961.1 hypothetical protein J5284_01540 [Rhizobium sp. AB2/73]UEQ81106.1 hypothetical protein I8E17_00775 [Rhizobium sp. AB2/73]